jgi:hypothetical protein
MASGTHPVALSDPKRCCSAAEFVASLCPPPPPPSCILPVGDIVPRNNRERIFVICVLVVGAAVYATVFANVTSLIGKLDAAGAKKNQSLTAINEFFSVRGMLVSFWDPWAFQICFPSLPKPYVLRPSRPTSHSTHPHHHYPHPHPPNLHDAPQMHELPDGLRRRTIRYFDAQWTLQSGVDIDSMFNELPEFLKAEIRTLLNSELVRLGS